MRSMMKVGQGTNGTPCDEGSAARQEWHPPLSIRKFKESARDQCLVALEEFGWFRALHSSPANSRFPLREVATTGRVLITVRSIETYHQNELRSGSGGASLNKAFQVVAKAAGQNKLLIKGEKEIKNVWARFRNSAHLAA